MELFSIALYPIEQLLLLIVSPELEEALGFSLPMFMIGLFIVSSVIMVITGGVSATLGILELREPEARNITYDPIYVKNYPIDAPQIGETRYLE